MKSSESRVNTMALIHRKLYGNDGNRSIEMKTYVQELVEYLIHSYGFDERKLQFILQSETIQLDVDKAIPLGLIINEVVSNALKYAYADHMNPTLNIEMTVADPNELKLVIKDNGPGISEASRYESPQSFGLKMVNTLAKEMKGRATTHPDNGTTFTLHIPTR
jgi:two-component sensor histidine kinase